MLDHHELLLQLDGDLHDRRQDDNESAALFADGYLIAIAWTISAELRNRWKLTSTSSARRQWKQVRAEIARPPRVGRGIDRSVLAQPTESLVKVPNGQVPVLLAADLCNLRQGILMLV